MCKHTLPTETAEDVKELTCSTCGKTCLGTDGGVISLPMIDNGVRLDICPSCQTVVTEIVKNMRIHFGVMDETDLQEEGDK